jgi:hypothetical protein
MMVHRAIGEVGIKVPPRELRAGCRESRERGRGLFLSEAPIEVAKHAHDTGGFDFHCCAAAAVG